MWSCINEVIGCSKQKPSPVNDSVSLDSINDFFQTVAISSSHKSAEEFCPVSPCSDGFVFSQISVLTVAEHLSKLDVHKATGPDGLSARYLKEIAEVIAPPLTSLRESVIPSAWKQSNITPVHKGGCIDDPSNYRTISVVPVVAKVLKRLFPTSCILI